MEFFTVGTGRMFVNPDADKAGGFFWERAESVKTKPEL